MIAPRSWFLLGIYIIWFEWMRPRRDVVIPSISLKFFGRFYDLVYAHLPSLVRPRVATGSLSSSELGPQTPLQYTLRPITWAGVTDDGNPPQPRSATNCAMSRSLLSSVLPKIAICINKTIYRIDTMVYSRDQEYKHSEENAFYHGMLPRKCSILPILI